MRNTGEVHLMVYNSDSIVLQQSCFPGMRRFLRMILWLISVLYIYIICMEALEWDFKNINNILITVIKTISCIQGKYYVGGTL
jgi:hypothetical protein